MPTLENPRYEAFAQARARGVLLMDAYESAGFVRHRGHPSRLAVKSEVAERIAELRAQQSALEDLSLVGLLASLRRIIKAGEASENPTLVNAARLAVLDAARLQVELAKAQAAEHWRIDKDYKAMAAGEFGAEPPEGKPDRPAKRPEPPRGAPAVAPSSPQHRPTVSPGAPAHLLASAAQTPIGLPGLSAAAKLNHIGSGALSPRPIGAGG